MVWLGLIGFSIFGLCVQGINTLSLWAWVLIAISVVVLVAKYKKNTEVGNEDSSETNYEKSPQLIEMPADAHDAVEAFAKLVSRTYAILDQAYTRDKGYYQACIELSFGEDDTSSRAEFDFHFDWNMVGFYEKHGYTLGRGFSVDGENVYFKSDTVHNLYSWIGEAATKKRNSGGTFDLHLAMALAEGIAATFVNNCPSAYVEYTAPSEEKFVVFFRFR